MRRNSSLAEVLTYPLVIRGSTTGGLTRVQVILQQLAQRGIKYRIALSCNGPLQIKESVRKSQAVGITYLAGLEADVASGRFVVLKGRNLKFTMTSYILRTKKRSQSPSSLEFLNLLRREGKLPRGKKRNVITSSTKKRGSKLASKSRKLVGLIPLIVSSVLDLLP